MNDLNAHTRHQEAIFARETIQRCADRAVSIILGEIEMEEGQAMRALSDIEYTMRREFNLFRHNDSVTDAFIDGRNAIDEASCIR